MKRALVALTVVAALAAAWFFYARGGGGGPAIARALPAERTVGLIGTPALDALARRWLPIVHTIPGGEAMLDPARRIEKLGFDPLDAKGWETIGLRAESGAAIVADAQLGVGGGVVPILLLDIRDRARFVGWLDKTFGAGAAFEGSAPAEHLVVDGGKLPMGRRGDYTAILMQPDDRLDEGLRRGFATFVADDGPPLAKSARWRAARDGADEAQIFAYADGPAAGTLAGSQGAPVGVIAAIDFYARLFPAVAGWTGDAGGARLSTSEAGQALVRRLVVPQRRPPGFARFVPATGWSALRVSVNLAEGLDAAADLVPPSLGEVASQLRKVPGMVRLALPFAIGASWDDIVAALSGHVVFAVDGAALAGGSPLEADGLVLLGVADGAKADALLGKVVAAIGKTGLTGRAVQVGGRPATAFNVMTRSVVAVRVDDVILVGPSEAVEAAMGREAHLDGAGAEAIDGDVVAGAWLDLAPALAVGDSKLAALLTLPPLKPLAERSQLAARLTLDRSGLRATADAPVPLDVFAVSLGAAMAAEFVHLAPPAEQTGREMGAAERFLRDD